MKENIYNFGARVKWRDKQKKKHKIEDYGFIQLL